MQPDPAMQSVAIPGQELNLLRGARLGAIRLDARVAEAGFEFSWTQDAQDRFARLVFAGVQYSRFEFEEIDAPEVVELVSIEAEPCVLGIRVFGEFSNGSFEFVSASFRVEPMDSSGVA